MLSLSKHYQIFKALQIPFNIFTGRQSKSLFDKCYHTAIVIKFSNLVITLNGKLYVHSFTVEILSMSEK